MPTSVHINFTQLHSKYQPDHNSATAAACCHVDALCIDIYFSLQMLNRNETFLQVWQAKSRRLWKNEGWTKNNGEVEIMDESKWTVLKTFEGTIILGRKRLSCYIPWRMLIKIIMMTMIITIANKVWHRKNYTIILLRFKFYINRFYVFVLSNKRNIKSLEKKSSNYTGY